MDRKELIIDYLYKQKTKISSSAMISDLSIPKRSLIRYIKELNQICDGLIVSDSSGYLLNLDKYSDYLHNKSEQDDRVHSIISRLLFSEGGVSIYDLSLELYASESTVGLDLRKAKALLSKYSLQTETENGLIYLTGSERNKRQLIKRYIYGEVSNGPITLSNLSEYFPDYDVEKIKHAIIDTCTDYGLYIDDFSLFGIILHVIVKTERNIYDKSILQSTISDELKRDEFYIISETFCKKLSSIINVSFSDEEVYELGLLLSSNLHKVDKEKESETYVTKEIAQLTGDILRYIQDSYDLQLDYETFAQSFSLHLKNLINRLKNNISVQNPLKDQLKKSYPFVYEISLDVLKSFLSVYGEISDDEIAYIVLHIASQIDKNEAMASKLHCTLISPDFYSLNKKLLERLKSEFEATLYIDNVYQSFDQIFESDTFDLIISTQQIPEKYMNNAIYVSILLPKEDADRLNDYINTLLKRKLMNRFALQFKALASADHYEHINKEMNYDDAIRYASQKLENEGIVPEGFAEMCIEREQISSTNFKDIAIPHPAQSISNKSAIFILHNEKAFIWNNSSKVKVIFLLAIKKDEVLSFKPLFDFISFYISNNDMIGMFQNTSTYESFIKKIVIK